MKIGKSWSIQVSFEYLNDIQIVSLLCLNKRYYYDMSPGLVRKVILYYETKAYALTTAKDSIREFDGICWVDRILVEIGDT